MICVLINVILCFKPFFTLSRLSSLLIQLKRKRKRDLFCTLTEFFLILNKQRINSTFPYVQTFLKLFEAISALFSQLYSAWFHCFSTTHFLYTNQNRQGVVKLEQSDSYSYLPCRSHTDLGKVQETHTQQRTITILQLPVRKLFIFFFLSIFFCFSHSLTLSSLLVAGDSNALLMFAYCWYLLAWERDMQSLLLLNQIKSWSPNELRV